MFIVQIAIFIFLMIGITTLIDYFELDSGNIALGFVIWATVFVPAIDATIKEKEL